MLMRLLADRRYFLAAAGVLFFLLLVVGNWTSLGAWFMVDDTANIYCSKLPTADLLFDKDSYRYCSQLFFTPLLFLSHKIDWALFELAPLGYHLHNLVAALVCGLLLVEIWERRIGKLAALIAGGLFLVSLPVVVDVAWTTRRHYLWGFALFLVAARKSLRGEESSLADDVAASIAFLLSLLFKEAFAFLPAVVLVLGPGGLRARIQRTLPFLVALGLYLLWRKAMIGGLGGYPGVGFALVDTGIRFLGMPLNVSEAIFGSRYIVLVLIGALALIDLKRALLVLLLSYVSLSPLLFFTSDGFELANKTLAFVALCCFSVGNLLWAAQARPRMKIAVPLIAATLALFGAMAIRSQEARGFLRHLADQHEIASREIVGKGGKVLVVSNYAYYFANLEYTLKEMMGAPSAAVVATGSLEFLPQSALGSFDRVVLFEGNSLDPAVGKGSAVTVLDGQGPRWRELVEHRETLTRGPPPDVGLAPAEDYLDVTTAPEAHATLVRCLYMGSYVGCYPVPPKYRLFLNRVKPVEKLEFFKKTPMGVSEPLVYVPEAGR